jgi:hypothetical protein
MTSYITLGFVCLFTLGYADCGCNSTDINQTYPCACQDYQGYRICDQAFNTGINYTLGLATLLRPLLDDYYYTYFTSNMNFAFSGVYCTGIPTCWVDNSTDTCRQDNYYAECNIIKNIVSTLSEQSSQVFFDSNIRKIISDQTQRVNVSISCDSLNQNYIIVNNNVKNTNSSKNKYEISIYSVLLTLSNLIFFYYF